MTKKRILDITTVKKRDNMQSMSNATAPGVGAFTNGPAFIPANTSNDLLVNTPVVMLWNATARDLTNNAGVLNPRSIETARTSTTPYMVGLREVVEVQTTTGLPWQWRRICFTYKGPLPGSASTSAYTPYREDSDGWKRICSSPAGDRNSGAQYDLFFTIFAGQNASDWNDPMVAKLDRTRITVKHDSIRTIAAGNESGMIRKYKFWHPMKHTLAYDDDESGQSMVTNATSVDSKVGMGDYYVLDLIRSRYNATAQSLVFNPSSTLYWHEK